MSDFDQQPAAATSTPVPQPSMFPGAYPGGNMYPGAPPSATVLPQPAQAPAQTQTQPQTSSTDDPAEKILRAVPNLATNVQADAWDAYHNSANEDELTTKLQSMNLPPEVKANLWDAKHASSAVQSGNESYGTPAEQQAAVARHALTRVGKTHTPEQEMTSDQVLAGLAGLLGGRGNPEETRQVASKLLTGFGVNASKDVEGVGGIARAVPAAIISSVSGMTYDQAKKAITPHFLSNDQGTGLLDANQTETEGGLQTVGGAGEDILSFLATEGALKGLTLGQKLAEVKRVSDILEKGGAAAKALRIGMNATRVGAASGIQTGIRGGTPGEIATSAVIGAGTTGLIEGSATGLKPAAQKLFSWVNAPKDLEAAEAALQATKEGSPDTLAKAKDALLPNKGVEGTELAEKVQADLEAASAKKSSDYEAARNSVTDQVVAAEKAGKPIRVGGNGSPIQQQAAEFATAPSGLPEGFQDVFNKVNPATDPKIAPLLNKFADEMTQPMSWDEAEKMRQQIGNAVRNTPYGDPTKWQWISMRNAMDETMEDAATKAGYPEISKDMTTLRSNYADALNRLEKNSVIKSLKDKDYDSVAKRLMSGNQVIQNVEDLRTTLKSVGGEDTMSAVENSVAQKLIDSATTTTADGTRQVNPNTLANKFFALSPDVREALWHENAPEIEKVINDFKTQVESDKAAVAAGKESTLFNSNNALGKFLGFSGQHIAAVPFLWTAFHKLENGDISGAVQDTVYGLAAGAGQHVAGKIVGNAKVQTKVLSFLEYLSHVSETGAEKAGVASATPKVPSLRPTGFSAGVPMAGVGLSEAEAANASRVGLPAETTIRPSSDEPEIELIDPTIRNNASGGNAASLEAISRVAGQKARGEQVFRVNTANNTEVPIPRGVDAVDAKAGPYDEIVLRDKNGNETVLDRGERAKMRRDRISTRVPTAVKATENALEGEPLVINRAAVNAAPDLAQKMADKVRNYDGVKVPAAVKDPAKVLDKFEDHVVDNLRWIYNQVPEAQRTANAKWYESANRLAKDMAEKHGMEPRQGAGVIAAMSPQKDWDMNVSLAQRAADIHHTQGDFQTSPEMMQKGKELSKKSADMKTVLKRLDGKTYSQLTDPYEKAAWVRIYDETYNPRDFHKIDPGTGNAIGLRTNINGQPSRVAWGSLNEGSKAISIMQDGSRENISNQMGGAHKVRNFYNNLIDPTNDQDVTIDTHAVAAGHMQPFSGNSPEVGENFNGSGSNATGVSGTYPLYADAYRKVAGELGILPRELQSVVWEWVRDRFSNFKTEAGLKFAEDQWALAKAGKITANQARQAIADEALKAKLASPKGKLTNPEAGKIALAGK